MRRLPAIAALLALTACSGADDIPREYVDTTQDEIINGAVDTQTHAVVAVVDDLGGGQVSACSGTIIHVNANTGIGHVLTAAHCGPPDYIIQGNDWASQNVTVYNVIGSQNHPAYDSQSNVYDFKMVRFSGAGAGTPSIVAATPQTESIAIGTAVRHVGYGAAGPAPGSQNTLRRWIDDNLTAVNTIDIRYNQGTGGPCSGDSGGPQLASNGNSFRVVGVTSYGDPNCSSYGVSGRVAAVYSTFIEPYINGAPIELDCDGCTAAATSGQGACIGQVNACVNSSECSALLDCFNNCNANDQACLQACANMYPIGLQLYFDIFDCVCQVGCVNECGMEQFCQGGGSSSSTSTGPTTTSSTSSSDASSGSGETTTGDGSTGSGTSDGAGGSSGSEGSGSGGFNAGGKKRSNLDGEVQTTGACNARAPNSDGSKSKDALFLIALGAALALARRRHVS